MTETLTNEVPMLTEDLAFNLGDVMACRILRCACPAEPVWLGDSTCGCYLDIPACDRCRAHALEWLRAWAPLAVCVCVRCNKPSNYTNWRPL